MFAQFSFATFIGYIALGLQHQVKLFIVADVTCGQLFKVVKVDVVKKLLQREPLSLDLRQKFLRVRAALS